MKSVFIIDTQEDSDKSFAPTFVFKYAIQVLIYKLAAKRGTTVYLLTRKNWNSNNTLLNAFILTCFGTYI